jgi:hypothetical protein
MAGCASHETGFASFHQFGFLSIVSERERGSNKGESE